MPHPSSRKPGAHGPALPSDSGRAASSAESVQATVPPGLDAVSAGFLRHELKTPIISLLALTARLSEHPVDPGQRQLLEAVAACGHHLAALIDRLVPAPDGALASAPPRTDNFDGHRFLDSLLLAHWVRARSQGIGLHLVIEPGLPRRWSVDGSRLRQILDNILTNAMNATRQGHVLIRACRANEDARIKGGVDLSIVDTGHGLDPAQRARIFELGVGGRAPEGEAGAGSGIGLFVSRRLATELGGRITCRTRQRGGATFTLTVPVADEPAARREAEMKPSIFRGFRCAVVLPEPLRSVAVSVLRRAGIHVCRTSHGDWASAYRRVGAVLCLRERVFRATGTEAAKPACPRMVIVFRGGRDEAGRLRVEELPQPLSLGCCEALLLEVALESDPARLSGKRARFSGSPGSLPRSR